MSNLIDITHTVKASAAPSEGARYMFDPATGERHWYISLLDEKHAIPGYEQLEVFCRLNDDGTLPVPPNEPPPPEPETPPEMPTEPEPAPEPEVPRKTKKLHHG